MGHKVSAVTGVKSDNYYEPGNAINEVWVGDVEVISRLPFGDSEIGQAGWPEKGLPKIPWRNFIIPMKRDMPVEKNNSVFTDPSCICPRFTYGSEWTNYQFAFISVFLIIGLLISAIFHALIMWISARQNTIRRKFRLSREVLFVEYMERFAVIGFFLNLAIMVLCTMTIFVVLCWTPVKEYLVVGLSGLYMVIECLQLSVACAMITRTHKIWQDWN